MSKFHDEMKTLINNLNDSSEFMVISKTEFVKWMEYACDENDKIITCDACDDLMFASENYSKDDDMIMCEGCADDISKSNCF
jgi:formylmethanofuran dehydrogenase subunit E